MAYPVHPQETQRVAALHALDILDTAEDETWDNIAKLASFICDTPIALVSLVDKERQWFKARVGLGPQETHRDLAFCGHAILHEGTFVIPDASADERFKDNALVTGSPDIRLYAGAPIYAPGHMPIGTVCAIDNRVRDLEPGQIDGLQRLAALASRLLEHRAIANQLSALMTDASLAQKTNEVVNEMADVIMNPLTPILLQLRRLRKEGADAEALEIIERNVKRIRDAVHDASKGLRN